MQGNTNSKKVQKDDRCEICSTCEEQIIDHSEADSVDIHGNYLIKKEWTKDSHSGNNKFIKQKGSESE